MKRTLASFGIVTVATMLLALPVMAQPIVQQGIDALVSQGGTQANINLPADFFCPGSPAISTTIDMNGVPIATNPPNALGGADTVVERLKDANLAGGCAAVPTVVRAVSLTGAPGTEIAACGTTWQVDACTCGCGTGAQPITTLTLCDDGSGGACGQTCGNFTGQLVMDICLTFTDTAGGPTLGPVPDQITLQVDTPWCDTNPGGVTEFMNALEIDTECDGLPNMAVTCTSNFFPGATCGGGQCPEPICHPADPNDPEGHQHCVEPPCHFCGDGVCDADENCNNCEADCPGGLAAVGDATAKALEQPIEYQPYCCGNGVRETSETVQFCNGRI